MFAQVACQLCGKPFQVPKGRVGETVACSWCGRPTVAVPLAVEAQPLPPDAPPRRRRWPVRLAYAAVLLLVAGGVFVAARLLGGSGGELREFAAPDGSFTAQLPGIPRERAVTDDEFLKAGKGFVSEPAWGGKVRAELGWFEVPGGQLARANDLFVLVRDRRAAELGATVESEAAVRVDSHLGREVRYASGRMRYVERYLFDSKADRPRVYWVGIGGADFDTESATAARAMGSLRVR